MLAAAGREGKGSLIPTALGPGGWRAPPGSPRYARWCLLQPPCWRMPTHPRTRHRSPAAASSSCPGPTPPSPQLPFAAQPRSCNTKCEIVQASRPVYCGGHPSRLRNGSRGYRPEPSINRPCTAPCTVPPCTAPDGVCQLLLQLLQLRHRLVNSLLIPEATHPANQQTTCSGARDCQQDSRPPGAVAGGRDQP